MKRALLATWIAVAGLLVPIAQAQAQAQAQAEPKAKRDLVGFFQAICFETNANREAALAVATALGFAPGEPFMLLDSSLKPAPGPNWRLTENGVTYALVFFGDLPSGTDYEGPPEDSCAVSTMGDGDAFRGQVAALAGVEAEPSWSRDRSWIRSDQYALPRRAGDAGEESKLSISTVTVRGTTTTGIVLTVPKGPSKP